MDTGEEKWTVYVIVQLEKLFARITSQQHRSNMKTLGYY